MDDAVTDWIFVGLGVRSNSNDWAKAEARARGKCVSRCRGSRAGHTRAGVGHQKLNKANGQAKKAEHDPRQGQSKDFMGEMKHWKVLFFYLLHCCRSSKYSYNTAQ